ncbi:hypothetical protein E2320_001172 [Naja naja]|nr:hypothetical protein E2320_001172 [Naja naja]
MCEGSLIMANDSTPVRAGAINVPLGHVIGHEKWKGSQIAKEMQGKVKLILEDGLGLVDFHLSNRCCILYISEADLVTGSGFKRRLVCFRNACNLQGIVFVEKTQISNQYFPEVQKFVILELGMTLLPKCTTLLEPSVLHTVQQIPGVGKTKALLLLENFGSIHQLCNASLQELEVVVGRSLAQQIHAFFTQTK